MKKRILAILLCAAVLAGLLPSFTTHVQAVTGGVEERLETIMREFPEGSYFTANGSACNHAYNEICTNCQLSYIMAAHGKTYNSSIYPEGWTCFSFASYIFGTVFRQSFYSGATTVASTGTVYTDAATYAAFSQAKPGDFVYCYSNGSTAHYAIFWSCDASGVTFMQSNVNGNAYCTGPVSYAYMTYASLRNYSGLNGYTIVRATNYDEIDSQGSTSKLTDPVVFNAAYYRNTNADLAGMTDEQLKQHWLDWGVYEGRCASPAFDVKWYLANNADVASNVGATNYKAAIYHFIDTGINEGRPSSPNFYSFDYYKANSQDLRAAYGSDNYSYYKHFVDWGYYDTIHGVEREANLIDGVYKFYSAKDPNYAMNIAGDSTAENANLHIYDKQYAHDIVVQSTKDGYYYLRVLYSGKYIEVYGNYTDNGSNVSQHTGNGLTRRNGPSKRTRTAPTASTHWPAARRSM